MKTNWGIIRIRTIFMLSLGMVISPCSPPSRSPRIFVLPRSRNKEPTCNWNTILIPISTTLSILVPTWLRSFLRYGWTLAVAVGVSLRTILLTRPKNSSVFFVFPFPLRGTMTGTGLTISLSWDKWFLDPLDGSDGQQDQDGDAVSNFIEYRFGTGLDNADETPDLFSSVDSDDDGYQDLYEVIHGSDTNDDESTPEPSLFVDIAATPGGDGSKTQPFNTIQVALDAAIDFDIIQVADGVYTGFGNKDLDYRGKPEMLLSEHGTERCIIDCEGRMAKMPTTVLQGVTMRQDYMPWGSGIYCFFAEPTVRDCIISENRAGFVGGGIYVYAGNPIFLNCRIAYNSAGSGGGIYNTFSNAVFRNCFIVENRASYRGGAIYNAAASPLFENCTIAGNVATNDGGGNYDGLSSSATLQNCILWDNAPNSLKGGALRVIHSDVQGGGGPV